MITHEQALDAATKLADYCTERFKGAVAIKCDECIFKIEAKGKKPRCVMQLFLGFCDKDLAMLADVAVREKYEYLKGFGSKK